MNVRVTDAGTAVGVLKSPSTQAGWKAHQKLLYGKTRGDVSEALSKQCRKF